MFRTPDDIINIWTLSQHVLLMYWCFGCNKTKLSYWRLHKSVICYSHIRNPEIGLFFSDNKNRHKWHEYAYSHSSSVILSRTQPFHFCSNLFKVTGGLLHLQPFEAKKKKKKEIVASDSFIQKCKSFPKAPN